MIEKNVTPFWVLHVSYNAIALCHFLFVKFYFGNVNISMLSCFKKFFWESGFSNFGHVTVLQNKNWYFGHYLEMVLLSWFIVVAGIYGYAEVSYENSYGKLPFKVGSKLVDPLVHKLEWRARKLLRHNKC